MKKLYLSILVLFCFIALSAQAPQSFRYQTVVRNTAGELLADHQVGLKISILKSSPTGLLVFSETYSLITTAQGLINLSVGTGNPLAGSLEYIDWSNGPYFLRLDVDINGGINYEYLGTSQLLSVPYALYAERAGTDGGQSELYWKRNENNLYYNEGNVGIGTGDPIAKLNIVGTAEENDERAFIRLKNYATGPKATVSIALQSFEDKGAAFGYASSNYSMNDLSDFGVFTTNGRGFALVAYTGQIRFYTNKNPDNSYSEKMRINEEGNVGIGTTNPLNKLQIEGVEDDWPGRIFLGIRNRSVSEKSLAYLKIYAGPGENGTSLGHISTTYTANEVPKDVAGYGILASSGNGLILSATKSDLSPGIIKFINGQTPGTKFIESMRINEKGQVGIGKSSLDGIYHPKLWVYNGWLQVSDSTDHDAGLVVSHLNKSGYGFARTVHQVYEGVNGDPYTEFRIRNNSDNQSITSWSLGADNSDDDKLKINLNTHYPTGSSPSVGENIMTITTSGNIGIGTNSPATKLVISDGDIYLEDISKGIIMKSPDGTCWRGTMNNAGTLEFNPVPCP